MKKCGICKKAKELSRFPSSPYSLDKMPWCFECCGMPNQRLKK